MIEKLWFLLPEIVLFLGAVVVSILGLAGRKSIRDLSPAVVAASLLVALVITPFLYTPERVEAAGFLLPYLGKWVKMVTCIIGLALVMLTVGMMDRKLESAVAAGRAAFDPIRVTRGEFYTFFLLSLVGVMLCCNANDLIWLFLALELTSLPTYVMIAISRGSRKAQESAVKYFFLGAMSAALFLYGFALLYGATGTLELTAMREVFAAQVAEGGVSTLGIIGMILALLGIAFKIAAAPMHFYAADVYEGAASAVTAFIAFVPKFAGFVAIMFLLATMGWADHYANDVRGLPQPILTTLWMVSVLTMTLGNVGALLQHSVKRMLAYSSIAHSGYMLIGIIAGPGIGLNSVLFYMFVYGLMNTAAFAVLAGLERRGQEIESLDDLAGLRQRHPWMAAVMGIAALSLLGVPPLFGFWGKLYLFIAGIEADQIVLVVIAAINSAISAWYYFGLVKFPILERPSVQAETVDRTPSIWPRIAALVTALAVLVLPIFTAPLISAAEEATDGYAAAEEGDSPAAVEARTARLPSAQPADQD